MSGDITFGSSAVRQIEVGLMDDWLNEIIEAAEQRRETITMQQVTFTPDGQTVRTSHDGTQLNKPEPKGWLNRWRRR